MTPRLLQADHARSRIAIRNQVNGMPNRRYGALLKGSTASSSLTCVPSVPETDVTSSARSGITENFAREVGLDTLPNDLTRMLYLASLRDCNSGRYFHPNLSSRIGVDGADRALCACHDEVFRRLLTTPISGCVLQLEEYMHYTRAERNTLLKTWASLQAYRATVPVVALPLSSELFSLNIEIALTILKDR